MFLVTASFLNVQDSALKQNEMSVILFFSP